MSEPPFERNDDVDLQGTALVLTPIIFIFGIYIILKAICHRAAVLTARPHGPRA